MLFIIKREQVKAWLNGSNFVASLDIPIIATTIESVF